MPLPLEREEQALQREYARIVGAQTVSWQAAETTLDALERLNEDPDRRVRERAWRLAAERRQRDRGSIAEIWRSLLALREKQAIAAGFPDYRAYRWQKLRRVDYTSDDCLRFHHAVEEWVTPVVVRLHEERRVALGLRRLQPWDQRVDLEGRPALQPFSTEADLIVGMLRIVRQIDPDLAEQVGILSREEQFDAAGTAAGLPNLFHELGHAFAAQATSGLPHGSRRQPPSEFTKLSAMSMELLAMSHLEAGGFYDAEEVERARRDYLLQRVLVRLPAVAMLDAFQHWAYTQPEAAADPDVCARQWRGLWLRFLPGVDWSGLDDELAAEWLSREHLFLHPFSAIEQGLAQIGAIQIWARARHDPAGALARYRDALALGATTSLPDLYAAAGARLAFDEHTIREAVDAVEAALQKT